MAKEEEEQLVSAAAIRIFTVLIFCGLVCRVDLYFPSIRGSEEFARSPVRCAAKRPQHGRKQVCYCDDGSEPRPKCLGGGVRLKGC